MTSADVQKGLVVLGDDAPQVVDGASRFIDLAVKPLAECSEEVADLVGIHLQ